MLTSKKNILIVIILILICHNSYCADESTQENLNSLTITTNNNCNKYESYCFLSGIKNGLILSGSLFLSYVVIVAPVQEIIGYNSTEDDIQNAHKYKKFFADLNLLVFVSAITLDSCLLTFLQNTILHSSLKFGLSAIMPSKLSNKTIHDKLSAIANYNIPIINLFSHKMLDNAKKHLSISATSTSCITELLTTFSVASFTVSIGCIDYICTGIKYAIFYILRTNHYKNGGYFHAFFYDCAVQIGFFSNNLLMALLVYNFILNTDVSSSNDIVASNETLFN